MEHSEATRLMAAERYLLNELTPEQRQSFEDHFFDCQECALEVQAGNGFIHHSKEIFAEPVAVPAAAPVREARASWFAWLRPAFAVPVFAVLLAVIAFQNLVSVPHLKQLAASTVRPQVMASLYLTSGTLQGAEERVIKVQPNTPFLLQVDIATDPRYSSYLCELRSSTGEVAASLPVPAEVARNTVQVMVPAQKSGVYKLAVRGIVSGQQATSEISSSSFELQVQQ